MKQKTSPCTLSPLKAFPFTTSSLLAFLFQTSGNGQTLFAPKCQCMSQTWSALPYRGSVGSLCWKWVRRVALIFPVTCYTVLWSSLQPAKRSTNGTYLEKRNWTLKWTRKKVVGCWDKLEWVGQNKHASGRWVCLIHQWIYHKGKDYSVQKVLYCNIS